MNRMLCLAAVALLGACDSNMDDASNGAVSANVAVANETAAAPTPDYLGTYALTSSKGEDFGTNRVNADHTYVETDPGGETIAGTWREGDDGKLCFDREGPDPEMCWKRGPLTDNKGQWTADNGNVISVVFTPLG